MFEISPADDKDNLIKDIHIEDIIDDSELIISNLN